MNDESGTIWPSSSIQGSLPLGALRGSPSAVLYGRPVIFKYSSTFMQNGERLGKPNAGGPWKSVIMVAYNTRMGAFLLLLLLGDAALPAPQPKPEIRKVQVDLPPPAPPPARPRKETAGERRKRRAEEKKMEAILKVLDSKEQGGLIGMLRVDSPGSSVFGSGVVGGVGGGGTGLAIGPPQSDRE